MADISVKMNVTLWPIHRLKPYEDNPRDNAKAVDAVAKSIATYGFRQPIVVDEADTIVAGHTRYYAALQLELPKVPVHVMKDATAEQIRAYRIADNRTGELAEWNEELLVSEIEGLAADGFDTSLLGWDTRALAKLLKPDGDERNRLDEIEEEEPEPITQDGELWLLGDHRLLCADTFEDGTRERLLGDLKADLILTDPPYAIYGSATGIGSDIADDKMVRPFFANLARLCYNTVKEFGHVYWHCDWRSWGAIWDSIKRGGLTAKNCIVWDKGSAGLGNSYANTYELIGFFAKLPKQKTMTSGAKTGQRTVHRPNVYRCNRATGDDRHHNAAKPVQLLTEILTNSSDQGEIVVDYFCGSGSTMIACEAIGRACRSVEMEPKWCDISVRRWEKMTGLKAERRSG